MNILESTVVENGFCIGCGICSATNKSKYNVELNELGMYQAKVNNDLGDEEQSLTVCPFYSKINETDIANEKFKEDTIKSNEHIGRYSSIYAGHVNDNDYRLASSSGGMLSWFLEHLLTNDYVDGIIHIKESNTNKVLFEYGISTSITEIRSGKKSRYYPIELSKVLELIKDDKKRYAIVGLPCFIKGVRLLKKNDSKYNNIHYFIGIVCGQLKSTYFSNLFGAQSKAGLGNLVGIDFRLKLPETTASEYAVELKYLKNKEVLSSKTEPARNLFGSDWGMGMFKYKACDACDDVYNETADIVFGDAWVEPYKKDWKGTNLIVIRNSILSNIFETAKSNDEIVINVISEEDAIHTQIPSIRHRRNLIGYRLNYFSKNNNWIPFKRFKPSNQIDQKTKNLQHLRLKISGKSHKAFQIALKYNSFFIFLLLMKPFVILYNYERFGIKSFLPSSFKQYIKQILNK